MFYSIRSHHTFYSRAIIVLQTAAHSFLEATLKTANSGSPVSLPESRDEAAKLFAGIKPNPDHMHWSVNRGSFIISAHVCFTLWSGSSTTFCSFLLLEVAPKITVQNMIVVEWFESTNS
jgi:hypothetical protein